MGWIHDHSPPLPFTYILSVNHLSVNHLSVNHLSVNYLSLNYFSLNNRSVEHLSGNHLFVNHLSKSIRTKYSKCERVIKGIPIAHCAIVSNYEQLVRVYNKHHSHDVTSEYLRPRRIHHQHR